MKNNKIYLVLLIILVAVAVWFYFTEKNGTIKQELRDFAVEDTASVSKIFMVNKNNKSILLERVNEGTWQVDGKYIARKDAVDLILKTLKRIDIKSPVSKASFENVVRNLAATNTKVDIYTDDEDKPFKTFYIGGPTQDQYGTYMMLENSSTPFITYIPGFSGYLSSRFFLDEYAWRDTRIFKYSFNQIKEVSLEIVDKPEKSYRAVNNGNNSFSLFHLSDNSVVDNFDTVVVKQYLAMFKKVNYERIANEISERKRDSIFNSKPLYIIKLKDDQNKETTITTFTRPKPESTDSIRLNEFDPDRMYARINDDNEVVIVQYFVFDALTLDIDYFIKK